MTNPSPIEQVVMQRIQRARRLGLLVNATTLSSAVFALALYGIGRKVWVARVLENAPEDLFAAANFYLSALAHTQVVVQTLCLVAAVSLVAAARSLTQSLRSAAYA